MTLAVSGLLLAGGDGRRLGGRKALVDLGGHPLAARAFAALAAAADEVLVVAGPRPEAALAAACPSAAIVEDSGLGPLGALLAGARAARGGLVLVAPCDAPYLTGPDLLALAAALEGGDAAVPVLGGIPQPLVACYRREALAAAAADALAEGRRAAVDVLARLDARLLDEEALAAIGVRPASLADVDTPEDLERARRYFASGA